MKIKTKTVEKILAFLGILISIIIPLEIFAFDIENWKKENDWGNRFEGQIFKSAANLPTLELISLINNFESYNLSQNIELKVKFFRPAGTKIQINAREIYRDKFYFMETKNLSWSQDWNIFQPWPIKDVIQKLSLNHDNLGVLIRGKNLERGNIFLPAIVYTTASPMIDSIYTFHFFPGQPLTNINFRIFKDCNSNHSIHQEGKISDKMERMPFPVKINMKNENSGWKKLEFEFEIGGEFTESKFLQSFCFYNYEKKRP